VVSEEVEVDDDVDIDEIELVDAGKVELDDAVEVVEIIVEAELALVELPVIDAAVDAIQIFS
jgi:hypothetical protein